MISSTFSVALVLLGANAHARSGAAQAPDTIIDAKRARSIPMDAASHRWAKAPPMTVTLLRQRTVPLMDRDANAALDAAGPRSATIRALYTADTIGVMVEWEDASMNELQLVDSGFGDAAAISFPTVIGPDVALPYIGMGDIEHPVVISLKRANADDVYERQFIAAGFGSLMPIDINTSMSLSYSEDEQTWSAIFVRPMTDHNADLSHGLVPFSIALWDGAGHERGGYKSVMRWHALRLEKLGPDEAYAEALRWGEDGRVVGDAAHGRELAGQLCAACHRFGDKQLAPPGMAPNLSALGGQAAASYIRDSIAEPSRVVVRNPNQNRHYNLQAERDSRGGFPANPMYAWFTVDDDGVRTSKMPTYGHLSESDVDDIVSFLKSIGTGAPPVSPDPPRGTQ